MSIRVLVADDQDIVRTGLRMILDAQPDIEVVAEASDGREALDLARRLRPDVCLFDIRMPELDGIELTGLLAGPDVADPLAIVVITTFDLDEYVHGALKAGARGYLMKNAPQKSLENALRRVAAGGIAVSEEMSEEILRAFSSGAARGGNDSVSELSDREFEVFMLIGQGKNTPQIADALTISPKTVDVHKMNIRTKLAMNDPAELAYFAIRWVDRHAGN